jgi:hypothetical protein
LLVLFSAGIDNTDDFFSSAFDLARAFFLRPAPGLAPPFIDFI